MSQNQNQYNIRALLLSLLCASMMSVLVAQSQQVKNEKENLEEENNELEGRTSNLESEMEQIEEELDIKLQKIDESEKEIKSLNNKIEEKDKQIDSKDKEIQEKNNEIKKLKRVEPKVSNNSVSSGSGKVFNMEATHYSAFCNTGCTGVTATGVDVSNTIHHKGKRVVAVDPNMIKLGSKIRVTGGGYNFEALAIDTGGDIKGNRIDILVNSTEEAYKLGRKNVKVEVLD